ncbi:MAG: SH3 domain-containing protein [Blautia sp.]|nr:SH3 domain-containing protein [Blautia sp.]MDD7370856.1 SH3 domain-containing protein [Bacillota bacterium]MDY3715622.1 SH3 domain-containing protein [Blautia sp.]
MLDNFREWLSDNLRYILLGLAILIVLVLLFFGIKALTSVFSKDDEPKTQAEEPVESSDDAEKEETQDEKKDENVLQKNAYPEVNSLIDSFYTAWGQKNVEQMKELTDSFDATDEAKVSNASYIENYSNVTVYTKQGLTEDSFVVFVSYDLKFTDVETAAPGLSQLYVMKNDEDRFIIHNDDSNEEINAYMAEVTQDADVQALITEVETRLNEAMDADPELKAFEEQLGEESNLAVVADDGAMLTVKEDCNFRREASTDAEVLDLLSAGTQVKKVTNGPEGWIEVEYEGQTGYISDTLLQ